MDKSTTPTMPCGRKTMSLLTNPQTVHEFFKEDPECVYLEGFKQFLESDDPNEERWTWMDSEHSPGSLQISGTIGKNQDSMYVRIRRWCLSYRIEQLISSVKLSGDSDEISNQLNESMMDNCEIIGLKQLSQIYEPFRSERFKSNF